MTTWEDITGATAITYILQQTELGRTIQWIVVGSNAGGSATATAAEVGPVTQALALGNVAITDSGGGTSSTVTVTRPTDTSSGALIVAFIAADYDIVSSTCTPVQAGWTQQAGTGNNMFATTGTSGEEQAICFTRAATDIDPAAWTFTLSEAQEWVAVAVAYADVATPVFEGAATGSDTTGPAEASASYTPTVANCRVLNFFFSNESPTASPASWSPTSASSGNTLTELADRQETANQIMVCLVEEVQTTATATVHTATKSAGTRGAGYITISIRPALTSVAGPKTRALLGVGS